MAKEEQGETVSFGESLSAFICSDVFKNATVFAGVIVAVISVLTARSLARKKQAADLLFSSRNDDMLQKGLKHIREHHDAEDKNIRALADDAKYESDVCTAIRYVLNHFEHVSIGIKADIYDEQMLKDGWYNLVIGVYKKTRPLVEAIREKKQSNTLLQEFEWLAKRWEASPLKVRKS